MSAVNTDELELVLMLARQRVLKIQTKLHRWARDDPYRRFDDLFNLVADPAFLLVAWDRVSGNKGAATAGVDRRTASSIAAGQGVEEFLDELRSSVKDRSFCPLPVRERMIPRPVARCTATASQRILLFDCYIEILVVGLGRLFTLGAAPLRSGWLRLHGCRVGDRPFPLGEWRGRSCGGGLNDRHRHGRHGVPVLERPVARDVPIVRRFGALYRCAPGSGADRVQIV